MNLPSYENFKENQSTYYAFATILALIFVFTLYIKSTNREIEYYKDDCNKEMDILKKKNDEKESEFKNYLMNMNKMLDKELRKKDTTK